VCAYNAAGQQPERCDADTDCAREQSAKCVKEIRLSFCLYDHCQVDADCKDGLVCQCGNETADPLCVALGCDSAADCEPNQECRVDESYSGVIPQRHCSTIHDSCMTKTDCKIAPDDSCGFDSAQKRWLCRPSLIVD
jgi:hypothetical protein